MPLHNTEAQTIETATAAESLPDPTTVNGRTHDLTNTGTVTCVWSSTGATPFQENGINVVTISVARGQVKRVQSDGTRWIVKPPPVAGRHIYAATGVTDGAGNVTFTYTTPFAATPVGQISVQAAASTNPLDYRITAISTTACTVNVKQSIAIVIALLGLTLLQIPANVAGITVHGTFFDAGETF